MSPDQQRKSQIPVLQFSHQELFSIISMAETTISYADVAMKLHGLPQEQMIQQRAGAALIQHKCQQEIYRMREASQAQSQAKQDEKAQGALQKHDSGIVTTPSADAENKG